MVRSKRILPRTGKSKVSNVSILFRIVNIASKELLKIGFLWGAEGGGFCEMDFFLLTCFGLEFLKTRLYKSYMTFLFKNISK